MAWETTTDRALMLGEFSGDGDSYTEVISAGSNSTTINCKTNETSLAKTVQVTDDDDAAIDLSGLGALKLTIERYPSQVDVQTCLTSDATLTVGGTGNAYFTFTPNSTVLAKADEFRFSLRQISTGRVLSRGTVLVKYAATTDPP